MADFEQIIKKHVGEDGNIPGSAIGAVVTAINQAVGTEYVDKNRYNNKISEIDSLKEKLQDAKDSVTTAEKYKKKYEDEQKAFSDYKAEQDAKAARESKEKAYKSLLKEVGIAEKWIGRATKGVSFDDMELDKDGKIKDADKLKETIKTEWGDCIETQGTKGADTATPPANGGHEGGKGPSRAAKIAEQYHADLYGASNKED